VDASVAVKWVVTEEDTPSALQFLRQALVTGTQVVAPLHMKAEVDSAVYRRLRLGDLVEDEAHAAIVEFELIAIDLLDPPGVSRKALELSLLFGWKHPYDAYYLAVGELLDCQVWTADRSFHGSASNAHPRLNLLAEFSVV
jgi:predicted nucleic acid-binding protein